MLINVLILYLNLFSYEKNHFISSDWELKKEENNIKVYLRKNELNNVEYLAETVINTNIDSILEIILDYDNSHKWMYKLEDSRIIEKKYDSLFYVYFTMEMGWPLKKRDLVSDVLALSISGLLKFVIIFSASFKLISLLISFIFDLIKFIIFSS